MNERKKSLFTKSSADEKQGKRMRIFFLFAGILSFALLIAAFLASLSETEPLREESRGESFDDWPSSASAANPLSDLSDIEISVPEPEFKHGWVINSRGYTYLYGDRGVEQFNYSDSTLNRFVDSIKGIAGQVPDGTSVFCMPVPTAIGFLYSEIPDDIKQQDDFFNSSQSAFVSTAGKLFPKNVTTVRLYDSFAKALESGSALFYRSDRNWTSDAAFLAYQAFCKASGNAPTSLEVYDACDVPGFLGSFFRATGSELLAEHPDTFRSYRNDDTKRCRVTLYEGSSVFENYRLAENTVLDPADAYLSYLGTQGAYFIIKSPCFSDRRLLIVGDQSAAAMIPFLIENYSEIHYIDPSRYRGSLDEIFSNNKFKDILIVSYLTNAVKGDFPVYLETIAGVING